MPAGDLHGSEIGIGGDALGGPDGIKHGGEKGPIGSQATGAATGSAGPTRSPAAGAAGGVKPLATAQAWAGVHLVAATLANGAIGTTGDPTQLLAATQGVIARPSHLATDIDAHRPIANRPKVNFRLPHKGTKLLGQKNPKLLDAQPFNKQGPQPRQIHRAIGADRVDARQLGDVLQFNL